MTDRNQNIISRVGIIIFLSFLTGIILTSCSDGSVVKGISTSGQNNVVFETELPEAATSSTVISAIDSDSRTSSANLTPNPDSTETPQVSQSGSISAEDPPYITASIQDLMIRYNISKTAISIYSVEEKEWPDAGLGCPLPGYYYAETITPGYLIQLQAINEIYTYHTDTEDRVVLCGEDGSPIFPDLIIPKGENIKDATPWQPVD